MGQYIYQHFVAGSTENPRQGSEGSSGWAYKVVSPEFRDATRSRPAALVRLSHYCLKFKFLVLRKDGGLYPPCQACP